MSSSQLEAWYQVILCQCNTWPLRLTPLGIAREGVCLAGSQWKFANATGPRSALKMVQCPLR